MRKNWIELTAVILTAAVVFGCIGYFAGSRSRGSVYEISGSTTDAAYTVAETVEVTETVTPESAPVETAESVPETTAADLSEGKVNINTATSEELQTLDGIGEVKAQAIIDYRTENGPFQVPEDLLKVSGIGEATLDKIIDDITVE
ncbi:MAG: ComEA family DNA-binding protein [Oscillospiraceae bacterium]|nr:ComEA family DNA-binding protein [Oscillospiraceae bacterium]